MHDAASKYAERMQCRPRARLPHAPRRAVMTHKLTVLNALSLAFFVPPTAGAKLIQTHVFHCAAVLAPQWHSGRPHALQSHRCCWSSVSLSSRLCHRSGGAQRRAHDEQEQSDAPHLCVLFTLVRINSVRFCLADWCVPPTAGGRWEVTEYINCSGTCHNNTNYTWSEGNVVFPIRCALPS